MESTGAPGRAWPPPGDTDPDRATVHTPLADRLTAEIEHELDAELLASTTTATVGSLGETDLPRVLGRAFQEVWTGELVVARGELRKTLTLDGGRPVYATSTAQEDRLGDRLLRQGRIDRTQRERVARLSAQTGRRTGAVLIDLGLCKPGELSFLLRAQHEEIITSLFSWTAGTFRFDPTAQVDPRRARLLRHPAQLLLESLRVGLSPSVPPGGPIHNVRFVLGSGSTARDLIEELALWPEEARALAWFDGVRTLEEVVRWSEQPEPLVSRIAFVLGRFGALTPVPTTPRAGRRFLDQRVDRERIQTRLLLAQDADYFRILGLGREAEREEVESAYRRLSDELRPDRIAPEVAVARARDLRVLRQILEEAWRVLGDDTLRRRYRANLPPPAAAR